MKVKLISFFIVIVLTSCTSASDPLLGFKIGSSEVVWKNKLKELTDTKNKLSFFIIGKDSIKAIYTFNEPYPYSRFAIYSDYDLYKQGKLRNIVIYINGDSSCKTENIRGENMNIKEFKGYGPKKKSDVEKVRKFLIELYGEPSETIESSNARNNIYIIDINDDDKNIVYKTELPNFDVEFYSEPYYYDDCFSDTMCTSAHIAFKIKNYKDEFEIIQEKIRETFKPNDLMDIKFQQPTFNFDAEADNYTMTQKYNGISRKGPEESRAVTDIKFDIVYINKFNEEVARIKDCLYEFKNALGPSNGIFGYGGYFVNYSIYNKQSDGYEYIRKNINDFKYNGKGKIVSEIKKVVFEDGSVLENTPSNNINENQSEFTFRYDRYASTQLNFSDFSWKFLQEFDESGDITIIGNENKIIIEMPGKGKELFIITKIQKNENGFIASTDKKFMIIFANDYNRIAIGEEGSSLFAMFIFKDADRENLNKELLKMMQ